MTKDKSIQIKVIKPCSENWEGMDKKGDGRFCENCKKIVVDLSGLSNGQLYKFFSNTSHIPCGRFRNDQLNKDILPLRHRKSLFKNLYKAVAALIVLFTARHAGAVINKKENTTVLHPAPAKDKKYLFTEKIIISGIVNDVHGHALENAEIKFGDSLVAKTDKEGKFAFELEATAIKSGLIYIYYPGMISIVRNYHPAMQSTSYQVTLESPISEGFGFTMGVASYDRELESMPVISINIIRNNQSFTQKEKMSLAELATWMRNHPAINIKLMAYIVSNKDRNSAKNLQANISKYLSDDEGISEERIKSAIGVVAQIKQGIVEITGMVDE